MAKIGRPTKYKPEYCKLLLTYFDKEAYTPVDGEDGKTHYIPQDIPFLVEFCSKIDVSQKTCLEWTKKHPEFRKAWKRAKEHQERILVTNASRGFYNAPFSIFAAKNMLGWRDKQEIDQNVKHLLPEKIQIEIVRPGDEAKDT